MNNNRNNNSNNNNNRRRGRGNRNQGGSGGNQGNRIDSRARGNAPQMLDKYKKLAQDAQHHGDRVQAEYYLQFADHYFRVIADNRVRQDEPRGEQRGDPRAGRRDERDQDDFESLDQNDGEDRYRYDNRERDNRERDGGEREGRDNGSGRDSNRDRDNSRDVRRDRPARDFRRDQQGDEARAIEASEGPSFQPEDNPFASQASEPREERPKRRAPRARGSNDQDPGIDSGIDVAALPSFLANDAKGADDQAEEVAPRPRRKRSGGGTLSAVG